jgi:hypothetical protein
MGKEYQQLKRILDVAAIKQAENSLLHRVEISILPPHQPQRWGIEGHPRAFGSGKDFLTGTLLDLRPLGSIECSVGTPNMPATSPRG